MAAVGHHVYRTTLVPAATRAQVIAAVDHCIDIFNANHHLSYSYPVVTFDDNASDEYADANAVTWSIAFNSDFVLKDLHDTLTDTVPHEVAHLIVDKQYPRQLLQTIAFNNGHPQLVNNWVSPVAAHGYIWQQVMRELGGDPCKHGYCNG